MKQELNKTLAYRAEQIVHCHMDNLGFPFKSLYTKCLRHMTSVISLPDVSHCLCSSVVTF